MLIRTHKLPPALVFVLVFLAFFGWQLSQGPSHEEASVSMSPMPAEAPAEVPAERKMPRVALMTFVTEERSYHHLSLKNKDRKLDQHAMRRFV